MKTTFLILLCCFANAYAQNASFRKKLSPPIVTEVLAGSDRLAFQMVVSKPFAPKSKFGFFSVSSFLADYNNKKENNEYTTPAYLTYRLYKGFSINSGAVINSNFGFRPFTGMQYAFVNKEILFVVLPGFYLTESHNFETFGIFEYKPQLSYNIKLYTRIQGLYNIDMVTNLHDRSFTYARIGLTYNIFTAGIGPNLDWYGPNKTMKENYGVFFRTEISY